MKRRSLHVVLAGASGFVGSSIHSSLVAAGHEVTPLSRSSRVAASRIDFLAPDARERLRDLPPFDVIINASGAPKFISACPEAMHRLHVDAVAALAAECVRRGSRLVHISTAYVTPHPDGSLEEGRPGARAACNIYEATKTMAEHLLADVGLPGIDIVRPAIVLPDDSDDDDSLRCSPLGPFMALAMGAKELPGNPHARLAVTRRSDLSKAIVRIIESPADAGSRWWNLVPTPMPELGEIAECVARRTGRTFNFRASSSRRLEAWSPYLCAGRSWETSGTAERLAEIGASMRPVPSELVASWCAALWDSNRGDAVA